MSPWTWAILSMAAARAAFGLMGYFASWALPPAEHSTLIPQSIIFIHVLAFSCVGLFLLTAGRRDSRAQKLGGVFLLLASSSSYRLFDWMLDPSIIVSTVFRDVSWVLNQFAPEGFLAVFVWMFFRDFPRSLQSNKQRRFANWMIYVSFIFGTLLFIICALPLLSGNRVGENSLFEQTGYSISSETLGRYAWAALVVLMIPSLPFSILKTRTADLKEKRRMAIFLGGITVGCGPMILALLIKGMSPTFAEFINGAPHHWIQNFLLRPLLITVPITTAYAVLVYRVMDVRFVVRKAIQYTFARSTVYVAAIVPFAAMAWYLYRRRGETLSNLFAGSGPLWLFLVAIVALTAVRLRRRVLNSLDHRFFREQYDSRKILAELVEKSRKAGSINELTELLRTEIDRALHLHSIAVLIANQTLGIIESPTQVVRPLRESSTLAVMAGGQENPMDVNLGERESPLRRLAQSEQEWIADGGFHLLVPLHSSDGKLIGLLALGEKKSELPFSSEDRLLLTAIAGSAALTVENRLIISGGRGQSVLEGAPRRDQVEFDVNTAHECVKCHRIEPLEVTDCHCGGKMEMAPVPYMLLGKFRFERRLGAGGMGVVYKAHDVTLNRSVAIKMLPHVTPEYSTRLRNEARAMAAVLHPNLAQIFGAETWCGTPLLIVEYLPGGTLADKLKAARLPLKEILKLGITLAGVLESMHSAGVLHRDIKPSNIGYALDGSPKLLDLGLAKIVLDLWKSGAITKAAEVPHSKPPIQDLLDTQTLSTEIIGTPAYLSPEALTGQHSSPSVDLWSLAVVLYEALTGKHPFIDSDIRKTLTRIRKAQAYDIRDFYAECPPELVGFFTSALSIRPRDRPSNAAFFRNRLESLQGQIFREERQHSIPDKRY
jgi:hypothetical protein